MHIKCFDTDKKSHRYSKRNISNKRRKKIVFLNFSEKTYFVYDFLLYNISDFDDGDLSVSRAARRNEM